MNDHWLRLGDFLRTVWYAEWIILNEFRFRSTWRKVAGNYKVTLHSWGASFGGFLSGGLQSRQVGCHMISGWWSSRCCVINDLNSEHVAAATIKDHTLTMHLAAAPKCFISTVCRHSCSLDRKVEADRFRCMLELGDFLHKIDSIFANVSAGSSFQFKSINQSIYLFNNTKAIQYVSND